LSIADVLPGLLFSTGLLMVISALPTGIVTAHQERYQLHSDWHCTIIDSAVMTVAIALVGGLFLLSATLIFGRRRPNDGIAN
jgi:hypothetical protein